RGKDLDADTRLPLVRVVAHRLGQAEIGELGRTQAVDHRADRAERRTELRLQTAELGREGMAHLRRRPISGAVETPALWHRARELVDLLARASDVLSERVDYGVELRL